MEVDIAAVREVLDGVENSLKEALRESVRGTNTYRIDNTPHLEAALDRVQEAIIELLLVR